MTRALDHVRSLWGRWWLLPGGLPVLLYSVFYAIGDLRGEHVLLTAAAFALAYTGPRTKRLFLSLLPFVITGVGYDLVKYARRALVTPDRVLGCELRSLELVFFHAGPDRTFPDVFASWHLPALDVLASIPYAGYIYVTGAYGLYLFFVDERRMRHYLWSFAAANFLAYSMWIALPAAPPWYIRAHGCTIDMSVLPSPAALARVDEILGIHYFGAFYSRAASVFGAMPSMHCAYPMVGLLASWRHAGWKERAAHGVYAIWMVSAAIYLDHHWVLDALAGWLVAALAVTLVGLALRQKGELGAEAAKEALAKEPVAA